MPARPTGSTNTLRELTLLYETDSPRSTANGVVGRLLPRTVHQSAPKIAMPTLGTTWCVYPPEGTDVVSAGEDFQPETPLTRATLTAALAETIAHHSTQALPWKFGGLVAAAVIAGFFALIRTSKGCRFTLVELFVVIAIIGVLMALMLPAVQSAREAGRRSTCMNNLMQIGLALHNYHDTYKQFPPAAIGPHNVPRERQFSWLVAILPFMEYQSLYSQLRLDLPWDHPHNAAVLRTAVPTLLCPADATQRTTVEGFSKTSYVAITGADATHRFGTMRGIIGFDRGLSLGEIQDGVSNTILVAEVIDGGPWFAAGQGTARSIDDLIEKKTWSPHPGAANVLLADGSVRALSPSMNPMTLRAMATAQGGEVMVADDGNDYGGTAKSAAPLPSATATATDDSSYSPHDAERKLEHSALVPNSTPNQPSLPPAQQARLGRGERARLSLGIALETHAGPPLRFRHEGDPAELVLGLQDRVFADTLQWFLVVALLLAAWIGRYASGSRQAIAVVAGLAVPIGLSGLVPLAWMPVLDGLLLGALAAGGLWIALKILATIKLSGRRVGATTAILLGLLLATNSSRADETRVAPQRPTSSDSASQPDLTLFIPYNPSNEKPLEKTQVYLPHDQFLRLWKQAHPDQPVHAAPGVQAIVSHAEYSGRLENDVARFDGRLLIHHLVNGWTPVMLPLGNVAFEKIEINGQPAALADANRPGEQQTKQPHENNGAQSRPALTPPIGDQPAIYLEKAGPHVVDVRFSVPVSRLGPTGQMTVPLRPVASGRLLFQLPAAELEVQVHGSSGGWRRQAAGSGGDFLSVPLGATNELSLRWQPRHVDAREGQLLSVDQALLIELLDSGIHYHGRFHYRIQQGTLNTLRLRIPPDLVVQSVHGEAVADWSIESDAAVGQQPAAQRLAVSLKSDLTTGTDVDIHAIRREPRVMGTIDVHSLEPLGVVRETGRVAIGCSDHFRVHVGQTDHMDQVNPTALDLPRGSEDGCAMLSAYRYTSRPWRLQLDIQRSPSKIEVSDRTAVAVRAREATLRSVLTAQITGAPVASLTLRLPASLRVSQVRAPSGSDWFIDRDPKGQQLKLQLSEPALGKVELAITGALVRDPAQAEFTVPCVAVENIQTQRGQLAIYLDDDLQAVLANESGARPLDPASLDNVLRSDSRRPANYAFQYESPPKDLRLRLSAAPSRASGDVTTVVSVREGAVAYLSKLDFDIRQAGRWRFQVATPEWLGDDVDVQGEHIRQIRSRLADHQRLWDIELQQPVRGAYRLCLTQTLPLSDDGAVRAPVIRPFDVERSRSHVVLENMTADEIAATTIRGAAPISIAEIPEGLTDSLRRQAVAAYRIADDAAALVWQRRTRQQEAGLMASINLADLTTVIHADGSYCARAAYNIRNLTLQFLEVELPPECQVWSVHVSGQPVHPAKIHREGRTITLLPLEKTSAGDFSSKIVVIYAGQLAEPLRRWTQVEPPAPRIVSDVPVSRTLWTLFVPREYRVSLVSGDSNLEEVAEAYQQEERKLSFLDELRQMVQVASTKVTSGAQSKARANLKQVGAALHNYAQQSSEINAKNAADVQEQAQQIEMEIRQLETLKSEGRRTERAPAYYFTPPRRESEAALEAAAGERGIRKHGVSEISSGDKITVQEEEEEKLDDRSGGRPVQRRGDLRKRAVDQLNKLKSVELQGSVPQANVASPRPLQGPQEKQGSDADFFGFSAGREAGGKSGKDGRGAAGTPAVGTGQLSLDLELSLVGSAYHFRKLHGEPHLVLRARHETLTRVLSALVWAGLCLAVAVVVIRALRRPHALARAYRNWPWLAAVAGTVWMFLLPAGVAGLVLLVTASCALVARLRPQQAPVSPVSNAGKGV